MASVHSAITSLSPADFSAVENGVSGSYRASDPATLPAAEISLVQKGGKGKRRRSAKKARKSRSSRKSCFWGGKSKKRRGSRRR